MKKSLLLIALPALMALSACGNAQGRTEEDNDFFKEDTIAHEEFFGGDEVAPRQLGVPDEEPVSAGGQFTLTPKVGVQFSEYEENSQTLYAVRYVAAVSLTSLDGVTASWTRAVSEKNSNSIKNQSSSGHNSTVLYASLNNGGAPKAATSETGGDYKNYLVYSMYDIPASQVTSYIAASLTLSKAGETDVKSRVVAAQINGSHYFSFDPSTDLVKDGYFLQSTAAGIIHQKNDGDATDPNNEEKDNAFFEGITVAAGEKFGLFRYTNDMFKFFGYDKFWNSSDAGDGENQHSSRRYVKSTTINQYGELYVNGTYNFYINKYNFAYTEPTNAKTTLYLKPNANWKQHADNDPSKTAPRFAINTFYKDKNNVESNNEWFSLTETGSGTGIYKLDNFNFGTHNVVIFCRMNGDNATNNWGNKWNQTSDLYLNGNNGPETMASTEYDVTEGTWDNGGGSWVAFAA